MFDYRYHALSLAAVLLALTIGVLIGVAIGDSKLASSARYGIVQNLRAEVGESKDRVEVLERRLNEEETFSADLYPITVRGLLSGRRIGLVFLGGSSDRIDELTRNAVTQAGGELKTVVAVREPLDLSGIAAQATGTRYTALSASQPRLIRALGVRAGAELVGSGRLLQHVRRQLLGSYDGESGRLDGVVLVREEPSGMSSEQALACAELEKGLVEGFALRAVPAVGVEMTSTEPSQVPWYGARDLASVDDLDTLAGQTALAFALAGDHGAFGVKQTADSLLPRVGGPGRP